LGENGIKATGGVMGTLSKHHKELTNGIGKCSVPMWCGGLPAGFCDNNAYSMQVSKRYDGYVPALACYNHGGKSKEEALNLCEYCQNHIAECESDPKFGLGKGNDNVYECSSFKQLEE
jgi:hypothetical protein